MFGDRDALIQIDMSEYMEKFTASRLIGSPPGYVGYEEGGQLSEAVRRRPYSVVLFDEIEKAHPDVMHLLLQILEDGKITDSLGRKIDFRNTIIIMTSNVGADILRRQTTMGFAATKPLGEHEFEAMRDRLLEEAKKVFKPEFINRLDDIIVFHQLTKADLMQIVELEVAKVLRRVKAKEVHIELEQSAKEFLIEKGLRSAVRGAADAPGGGTIFGRSVRGGIAARKCQRRRRCARWREQRQTCLYRCGSGGERSGERELTATAVILSESRRIPPCYLKDPPTAFA